MARSLCAAAVVLLASLFALPIAAGPGRPAPVDDSVIGPALRHRLAAPTDPTELVPVIVYCGDGAEALARAVESTASRFSAELDDVRAELAADVRLEVGPRPVRTRDEERANGIPLGPMAPYRAELLARLDRLQSEARTAIAAAVESDLAPTLDRLEIDLVTLGAEVSTRISFAGAVAAHVPYGSLASIATLDVARIELDARMTSELNVSNAAMGTSSFWSAGRTGGTFDVAIADSGIDDAHPAFSSQTVIHGVFLATAGDPEHDDTADDVNGHGCHVGGISASADATYRGVAYGLDKIFNVKAGFDHDGNDGGGASMYHSDGMDGVDWAVTYEGDNADVVNLSYGGSTSADDSWYVRFYDAVVSDLGVAVTISAGNSGPGSGTLGSPGIAPNVICVANMNDRGTTSRTDDVIASSSSRGPTVGGRRKPDIAAPGTAISSANNTWEGAGADWVSYTGTSMAAPQVAGALVLLCDAGITDPLAQKALLLNTAEDRGAAGWDATYGWGYIDLEHAYEHRADVVSDTIEDAPACALYAGPALEGDTATLVWNRRATYAGGGYPSGYSGLTNLDLYLYDQADGALLDSDTSTIDNVHQVEAPGAASVVVKVDAAGSISGASSEAFALALEEGFTLVEPSGLTIDLVAPSAVAASGAFVVEADVSNATGAAIPGCNVTLTLPNGFSLNNGTVQQSLGVLANGATASVSWNVIAPAGAGDHDFGLDLAGTAYGESFARHDSAIVTLGSGPDGADGIGIHYGPGKAFFLKNVPGPGGADTAFRYGGATMIPLVGDWDGDGDDTIGLYLESAGAFFLRNANSQGVADLTYRFGPANRTPLAGDWDGDGDTTIGIYDEDNGAFFLRNDHGPGPAAASFRFGPPEMIPVVGDWDGDGTDTIGIYHPGAGAFFLRDENDRGAADHSFGFGPETGGVPIVGDWDGDGIDTVGIYDPVAREFWLTNTHTGGDPELRFRFGGSGITPIAGNWTAD